MPINILKRYFSYGAKALRCEVEKRELYKQIRALSKKQQEIFKKQNVYEKQVREMHNNGLFKSYGEECNIQYNRLYNKK